MRRTADHIAPPRFGSIDTQHVRERAIIALENVCASGICHGLDAEALPRAAFLERTGRDLEVLIDDDEGTLLEVHPQASGTPGMVRLSSHEDGPGVETPKSDFEKYSIKRTWLEERLIKCLSEELDEPEGQQGTLFNKFMGKVATTSCRGLNLTQSLRKRGFGPIQILDGNGTDGAMTRVRRGA